MRNLLSIGIFCLCVCVFGVVSIYAKNNDTVVIPEQTSGIVAPAENLDYPLPYPGILIDHPLYIIKRIRDEIMRTFVKDPVKHVEFSLLQSDKYLSMAIIYADKRDWLRVKETVFMSLSEMDRSVQGVKAMRNAGEVIPSHVLVQLERSTVKHSERVGVLTSQIDSLYSDSLKQNEAAFIQLATQASALRD